MQKFEAIEFLAKRKAIYRKEVLNYLGKPLATFQEGTKPSKYCTYGHRKPTRDATAGGVIVYVTKEKGREGVIYIFFDENNKVIDTFICSENWFD